MVVRRLADAASFLDAAEEFLLTDEARHNLMLGIAGGLREHPGLYDELRGWIAEEHDKVVGAALQTPPFNLVVARPAATGVLHAIVDALVSEGVELPGVTAALPEADEFAQAWLTATGLVVRPRTRQRIYRLTDVRPVSGVPGHARIAGGPDRTLVLDWVQAFGLEALGNADPEAATRVVDARLEHGVGGFAVWEDEERPVSLAGWGGRTPHGVRIGPVYTPAEHRRRGYAGALTAWVSAERLVAGCSFCFLYTDLDNPTSNRIYSDIGYEPVCDSVDFAFEAHSGAIR